MSIIVNEIDAVIMAGGSGQRMNLGFSKVLLTVNNKSLLEHSIEQLKAANVNRIFIICDKHMYDKCNLFENLFSSIYVYKEKEDKYDSTFLMLKEFLQDTNLVSNKLLFVYGHAPRNSKYYNYMLEMNWEKNNDIFVTQLLSSTRRDKIVGKYAMFIEPPYIVNKRLIELSSANSWSGFFKENMQKAIEIGLPLAPNEFNFYIEYLKYAQYIENNYWLIA